MKLLLNKRALSFSTMLFLFLFSSCSRRGCTDTDAENYEPTSKTDCGCCYYAAKGVVWFQKSFSDNLKSKGVTTLKFFTNGESSGEITGYFATSYDDSAPSFSANNSDYSFYKIGEGPSKVLIANLGSFKSKNMELTIQDQNGNLIWKDSVLFKANRVIAIQL